MGPKSLLADILSLESFSGTDAEIAAAHENNRQSTVKEILLHVFFLARSGKLQTPSLTCEAAKSQYFYATGDDQAAHCVPGQLLYNGQPLQNLTAANSDLFISLENLFGRTDGLHGRFNKADSRAEENGLRAAMAAICNIVVQRGRYFKYQYVENFFPLLDAAFGDYMTRGVQAFDAAIQRQQTMTTALQGVTRAELIAILEAYRNHLETADRSVTSVQGFEMEARRLRQVYRTI
jgi:hypothetical protein